MKTTIELPDELLAEAKQRALDEKRTLKDVFGTALEQYLHQRPAPGKFKLETIVTKGEGLQVPNDWETIRDLIYPYPFPMNEISMGNSCPLPDRIYGNLDAPTPL